MSSFVLKSQANVGVKSNESLKDLHHFLVTCVLVFLTIVFVLPSLAVCRLVKDGTEKSRCQTPWVTHGRGNRNVAGNMTRPF
jgi:hypothetical protein